MARSPKSIKRPSKPSKCYINRNSRKWKNLRLERAKISNWIVTVSKERGGSKAHKVPKVTLSRRRLVSVQQQGKDGERSTKDKQKVKKDSKSTTSQLQKLLIDVPAERCPSSDSTSPAAPLTNSSLDSGIHLNCSPTPDVSSTANGFVGGIGGVHNGNNNFGHQQEAKGPTTILRVADEERRSRSPRSPRMSKLLPKDIDFCVYMLEHYGEDFELMSKDKRNVFNDPPEMIARKLRIFRESPYFTEYVERQQQKQS